MSGHLFITRGDLLHLACDAILIPSGTDAHGTPGEVVEPWLGYLRDQRLIAAGDLLSSRDAPTRRTAVRRLKKSAWPAPDIWAGFTGDDGRTAEENAEVLTRFVREATKDLRAESNCGQWARRNRRPLLGVPFVGTGRGGQKRDKGTAVKLLVEALLAAVRETNGDVVLVLNNDGAFAAAQQARARLRPRRATSRSSAREHLERLTGEVRSGMVVPFLGAGVSIAAGGPSWEELLDSLWERAVEHDGIEELRRFSSSTRRMMDSRDIGTLIERALGRQAMQEAVRDLVSPTGGGARSGLGTPRVSLPHQLIASLPHRSAITTNYDQMVETAWADAGHEPAVLPKDGRVGGRHWLLKLHGSVDDLNRIVLSRGDYLRFDSEEGGLAGVVSAMLLTQHLLFIGYSMRDDNFHRIVQQVRTTLAPYRAKASEEVPSFGTVLTDETTIAARVWPDVQFVKLSDRDQAIFLDDLVAECSPPGKHLLDPTYDAVFNDDERALRDALDQVRSKASAPKVRPALSRAVLDALKPLGANDR